MTADRSAGTAGFAELQLVTVHVGPLDHTAVHELAEEVLGGTVDVRRRRPTGTIVSLTVPLTGTHVSRG